MDTRPTETSLSFHAPDDVSIPAIVRVPSGSPQDIVLMLHGITTHKNEFADFLLRLAKNLAEADIASVRIDFRGHGDSALSSRSFSVSSQVLDIVTAIDGIGREYPSARIHLLACSFGGPAALYASEWREAQVSTVSLICPVLDYRRTFLEPTTDWARALFNKTTIANAWHTGRLAMTDTFDVDLKLLIEMAALDPAAALRRARTPIVVVHGEADSMVPFQISKDVCAGLPNVRLVGIPHMEHGFTDVDDDDGTSAASERNLARITSETIQLVRTN